MQYDRENWRNRVNQRKVNHGGHEGVNSGGTKVSTTARPIGRNQIGKLDRLRNMKRLRIVQSCPV